MPSGGGSAPGSDLDLQWPVILTWPLCVQRPSGSWSLEHRPCPGHRGGRAGAGRCPGSSRWWWGGSGKCPAAHGGGSQLSLRPPHLLCLPRPCRCSSPGGTSHVCEGPGASCNENLASPELSRAPSGFWAPSLQPCLGWRGRWFTLENAQSPEEEYTWRP